MATIKICTDESFISNDSELAVNFNYEKFAEYICFNFSEIDRYEFVSCAFHFVEYISEKRIGDKDFEFQEFIQTLDLSQFFD